ncbi:sialic acid-binding Ig-like lectin 14 isoform X3 [Alosa alosa]|uniref:sialic acid-binding Ig-like lectin 14 isoform X3 n=1 Tax=Alosa alosa TaxID=278164 RepID=UPI0020155210|nr:sialic acid-binding Ig-like lectin 14 isoform X3 [Alosa alosa]XP_048117233.1 sialic acid-binding Ig-like lectin 14 isoform X3 [Alosa alosa]
MEEQDEWKRVADSSGLEEDKDFQSIYRVLRRTRTTDSFGFGEDVSECVSYHKITEKRAVRDYQCCTRLVMETRRLLRLFGICFTAACLLSTAQGFSVEMPASVRAVEGSCVLVPCQTRPHTRVIWYKHQTTGWPAVYDGIYPRNVIGEFKGRTAVLGSPSEGNCTLRINNVKMSDGITLFPYINPESDKYYKPTVQIKTEPRSRPVISGPECPVQEGAVFRLSCSVQHSCPPAPPAIEWRGLTEGSTGVSTQRAAELWVEVSTVTVTAARSQHGKQVHCRTGDMSTESESLTLDIAFLSIMVPNTSCSERGRMLRCVCQAEANPVATVTWMLNGRTELPASIFPNISTEGTLMSAEVELEQLAEQGLACVANNYITATHQMTLQRANKSTALLPWIMLAVVCGILGLCGFICCFRRIKQRNSDNTDVAVDEILSRPQSELGVKGTMVQEPEQNEMLHRNKTDQSVCATETEDIYDNDHFLQTQFHRPQSELGVKGTMVQNEMLYRNKTDQSVCATETEDIYDNDHFLQTQSTEEC